MTIYYPSTIKYVFDPIKGLIQEIAETSTVTFASGTIIEVSGVFAYVPEDPSKWSIVPTNLVQAVDYLAAGSGSGGGGGGGTPGGSNGDIQYRVNGTTFGGVSKIRFVGGDVFVTGSFLGDVNGTASYATNAGNALTASFVQQAVSASFATSALTASYVLNAVSSSFATSALTASYVLNAVSSSFATNALTASYVLQAVSASYANNALSASYSTNALSASFASTALTASFVQNAVSASYATNALSASYASNADLLDNLNSTDFARLAVSNAFTANQVVTGSVTSTTGFTGSLTKLTDGSDYLVAGTNITLTTGSNGAITIDAGAAGIVSGSSKNVIYVAKNGSNSSISGSISSPFLTIQGAINYIESKRPSVYSNTEDVVILVAPGIYSEDITFTKPFINVMGYVPTQYSKATQINGLVNINNTSNPGGGTGQTFGLFNFLITAPTTASANVISFSGTGNGSLVLENMQAVGGGSNQSILYVSKSAAVATNCRVKVRHSIFNTETSGSSGPTANIFNVYSVFESCEIGYSGSVAGGTVLNTNNATVDFLRGTLTAGTSNSVVAKITGSSLTPLTVGDTAVLGTSTGTNGFLIAPGATFVSGKNAFSIATGTTFVVSGSATSNFVTAFDGILAGGILYNNRISNTMTTTFGSASYTKVT